MTRRVAGIVFTLAAAIALWIWARDGAAPPASPADPLAARMSTAALAESVDAAHARHDWSGAMRWGESLVARRPRDPDALIDLGLAVHNFSLARPDAAPGARPPLRTSLRRAGHDSRALALMSAAEACARKPEDWARARRFEGNFYEILGLPLEALDCYETILARAPRDSVALARRYWVATHLLDPGATDFPPAFDPRVDPLPNRVRRAPAR
jgi:tetratricopeptide (TPR) repeat protein